MPNISMVVLLGVPLNFCENQHSDRSVASFFTPFTSPVMMIKQCCSADDQSMTKWQHPRQLRCARRMVSLRNRCMISAIFFESGWGRWDKFKGQGKMISMAHYGSKIMINISKTWIFQNFRPPKFPKTLHFFKPSVPHSFEP